MGNFDTPQYKSTFRMKNTLFLLLINLISCNYSPNNNPIKEIELIDKLKELDAPLKTPEAGEWLFENKEKGQTFETYKTQSPVRPNAQQTCIYIQPIGVFTEGGYKIIQYTAEYVELFFNLKTIVLNSINDTEIPAKSRRINNGIEQLHTKYILDTILNHSPNDALVTMAITAKDLYPEDAWNYVFGEAYKEVGPL